MADGYGSNFKNKNPNKEKKFLFLQEIYSFKVKVQVWVH